MNNEELQFINLEDFGRHAGAFVQQLVAQFNASARLAATSRKNPAGLGHAH